MFPRHITRAFCVVRRSFAASAGASYSSSPSSSRLGDTPQRVSKILAWNGVCSKREAEKLIDAGRVRVNGEIVREQGVKVIPSQSKVTIDDYGAKWIASKLTLVLHKPCGLVSNLPGPNETGSVALITEENAWRRGMGRVPDKDIAKVVKDSGSFHVAGRLDKDSRGLLICTQDGVLARSLIGGHGVAKVYLVTVHVDVQQMHLKALQELRELDGAPLLPMGVRLVGERVLEFRLRQGRKRQIRRVCDMFGLGVVDLYRVRIGNVSVDGLPEGGWRLLTANEISSLRSAGETKSHAE